MTTASSPQVAVGAGADGRRPSRLWASAVWLLIGVAVLVFVAGVVIGIVEGPGATPRVLPGWTAAEVSTILAAWGLPEGTVVAYFMLLECATFAAGAIAAWSLLRGPWTAFRCYVALVVLYHTAVGGSAPALLAASAPALDWAGALTGLGWFGLFSLLLVFPDGRFVPGWTRWTVPAWAAVLVGLIALDDDPAVSVLSAVLLGLIVTGVAAQLIRFRRTTDPVVRSQTRWVVAALVGRAALVFVTGSVRLLVGDRPHTAPGLAFTLAMIGASYAVSALLVLTVAVAVVRHRLFGADLAVSRAVVHAGLSVFLLLLYGLMVGGVGLLWRGGDVLLPVLATVVAAVTLMPVRAWLQRRVARLIYGERAEPHALVRQLGERLATTGDPEQLLQTLVDVVGSALGLQRVSVVLAEQGPIATYRAAGAAGGSAVFPIEYQRRAVGRLEAVTRPGERFSAADRQLLATVAGQAGLAVLAAESHAAAITARDEVIDAREDERRRMHRDLHDGLGPTLASVYQRVELASRLASEPPVRQLLQETGAQVRETIGEVRRLVHRLGPARLDALGLVEALRAAGDELSGPGRPAITIACPAALPPLRAAVERSAYLIALEALTNASRHSGAAHCTVEVLVAGDALTLTVRDDGCGLPAAPRPGVGLDSMRQRAAEGGGTLSIVAGQPSGTVVSAVLPLRVPPLGDSP